MSFYTSVHTKGNFICYRGIEEGRRVTKKVPYRPTFFVPTKDSSEWQSILTNRTVEKFLPGSINESRDFLNKYEKVDSFEIYGNPRYEYAYITENYPEHIEFDPALLYVANIDIEVDSEDGFASVERAEKPILSITIEKNGEYFVWGYSHPTGGKYVAGEGVTYFECVDEITMLKNFVSWWSADYPDVITGWNISLYDIPMLLHRLTRLFSPEYAKKMSPWGKLKSRTVIIMGRENITYELIGINSLDLLELFRKFSGNAAQESYRLDHIGHVIVGERKLSYDEYRNLHTLYIKDYQKFIEYNIKDTTLVKKINDKEKLLELAYTLAYDSKVNPGDVFSQVRMWTQIVDDFLWRENKVASSKRYPGDKDTSYSGAYVKDPQNGVHEWVASFDLVSLYPHLIMQFNISPDTIWDELMKDLTVESMLEQKADLSRLKYLNCAVTPNGALFDRETKGFAPRILEKMFAERDRYKKLMIAAEKEIQTTTDPVKLKELTYTKTRYKNLQMTKKVCLNSYYGATGNAYFFLYDVRQAEGVTTAGRLVIQWAAKAVNAYMNTILSTEGVDYILASDTDSLYIHLAALVDKVCQGKTTAEKIDFLDKVCDRAISPVLELAYKDLAEYVNAFDQKMSMKRESLCDKTIWTGKKHYILNIHNKEGVAYDPPQIEVKGLELVKSSTPTPCREKMRSALPIIMNQNEAAMLDYIAAFKKEFMKMNAEEIAFPRSVNGLSKYAGTDAIYAWKTPMHTKASLIYNHHLKQLGIDNKYELIKEGEKIKYVYVLEPNVMHTPVIAFPGTLPEEFDLKIDYNTQFGKSFIEPMKTILDAIGWQTERTVSFASIFAKGKV